MAWRVGRKPGEAGQLSNVESIYSDDPIQTRAEDRLERARFVELMRVITDFEQRPKVVGLYGRWGSGKTSVLNLLESELLSRPNVVVVRFDGWH